VVVKSSSPSIVTEETPTARSPLERLLQPVEPVRILTGREQTDGAIVETTGSYPGWLRSGDWRLFAASGCTDPPSGTAFATFTNSRGERLNAFFDDKTRTVTLPFSLEDAFRGYATEAWTNESANRRLPPDMLNLFYRTKRLVPRSAQIAGRRLIIRWQGQPEFPAWPLDLSVSKLLRFYAFCLLLAQGRTDSQFRWFWPESHHAAMILTHDIENESGVRRALAVADLEEELGFRSSFNFGAWYRIDAGLLRELTDRGFEVGIHGLRHDRSLFESRSSFVAGLPRLREFVDELGARGFRSPATYRVHEWLSELPFDYDCSVPHSDPFEPQPGGCCSFWPYFLGPVVELPYTLPQDYTLFTLLRHRSIGLWLEQSERLVRNNGLIQCVTHPDDGYLGDPINRGLYKEFLVAMAERQEIWRALPRDVADWWRERDGGGERVLVGTMRIAERHEDVAFVPPSLATTAPTTSRAPE